MSRTSSWLSVAVLTLFPAAACAQESTALVVGAGVGGSYYCILSRCDTGTIVMGVVAYDATRVLSFEGKRPLAFLSRL